MIEPKTLMLPVPVNERDHVIGPAETPVTVVTYGDYGSSGCHRRHRATEKMFGELLGSVRFIYRHFPLISVHPRALRAAEAAEAAGAQSKFWEMHRRLYTQPDKLEDRHLRHYAKQIELDLNRFDREMASGAYRAQILGDYHNSLINGITGAPTTFINGELYAMSDVELLTVVKTLITENESSRNA